MGGNEEATEFDYRAYAHSPENLIQMSVQNRWTNNLLKEKIMTTNATQPVEKTIVQQALPSSLSPIMGAADRNDPRKELNRVKMLTTLASSEMAQRVDAMSRLQGWISEGVTLEAAQGFVMNELAGQTNFQTSRLTDDRYYGRNSVGRSWESGEGLRDKIVDGIYSRVDRKHEPTTGREFAGASLSEIADICLQQNGKSTAMASVASRVEMALHGTSDFPNILTGR